jgi:site-specific recombinase XerD
MKNQLPYFVTTFLTQYLGTERGRSENTISAYRDTIKLLLEYLAKQLGKSPDDIRVEDADQAAVVAFLEYGEKERGWKPQTRNQRLASLKTLFRYIARCEPQFMLQTQNIRDLANKKTETKPPEYLEDDEFKAFLESTDPDTELGLRDQAILLVAYCSAGRASEIIGIKIEDLQLDGEGKVVINGKGRKQRSNPLTPEAIRAIRRYLEVRRPKEPDEKTLFLNARGVPLTRFGLRYLLEKLGEKAAEKTPSISNKNITPHLFRHTAAIFFLRSGADIFTVSRSLGHTHLNTTNLYLETDMETKRQMLKAMKQSETETETEPSWYKPEIIQFLDSLNVRPSSLCEAGG